MLMDSIIYKDLKINFTNEFSQVWDDKGSRGDSDGAYWRPIATLSGYHPLGDYGCNHYNGVNGQVAVAIVSDINGPSGTALRPPMDYQLVWTDKGSGADADGSIWRPIPPTGYVALGLVCNKGYNKPSFDIMRCVRVDLVISSLVGDPIWDDKGTGSESDFSSWQITPPGAPSGEAYLSAGTFVGVQSHQKPSADVNAYALRFQVALSIFEPSPRPVLHNYDRPSGYEETKLTYISYLPWFTVKDPNLTPATQLLRSPVYRLERFDEYKLIGHGHNTTTAEQTFSWESTTGTSGESYKSFTSTTSIEMGAEWGLGDFFTVSAKLSQSFSHTAGSSSGWTKSTTNTVNVAVPSKLAVAGFTITSTYKLYRQDGTQLSSSVTYSDGDSIFWAQYPPLENFNLKISST